MVTLDQLAPLPQWVVTKLGGRAKASGDAPAGDNDPMAPITDLAQYVEQISNNDRSWEEWNTVLMAIFAASGGSDLGQQIAVEWSEKAQKYTAGDAEARWERYRSSPPNRIGAGMLRRMAADEEWIRQVSTEEMAQYAATAGAARATGGDPWGSAASAEDAGKPFLMTENDIFDMPDPMPLVKGMLMERENTCLVAPPKSGKTYLALDIALSIAAGVRVLESLLVCRQGPVVYLTAEGKMGFKRRILAWRQSRGITPDIELPFYFKGAVPMTAAGAAEAKRYVDGIRSQVGEPVLVVIDTMARSLGSMDENAASSAAAYLNLTEAIRAGLDTTLLTLAHASDKPGAALQIRGSSGFGAGFDSVWTLRMDKSNRTAKMQALYMKEADESDGFGPWCFRLQSEHVDGMENGRGAVLKLVSITEWNESGETTGEDVRVAYLRRALEAAGGRKFTTIELAQYLVERDLHDLLGVPVAFDEFSDDHQTRKAKKQDFLKNGTRMRGGKNQMPQPGYFAEFFEEHALGVGRPDRIWRAVL